MFETDALVEIARRVPVQNIQIDTAAAPLRRQFRHRRQQLAAHAVAPRFGRDVEVLHEDAGPPFPGGIVAEAQREADRLPVQFGDQRLEHRTLAPAVAPEILLGRLHGVGFVFEFGQFPDEAEDGRAIGLDGRTDGHGGHSGSRSQRGATIAAPTARQQPLCHNRFAIGGARA